METVTLNKNDVKFHANFDGQTFGFALTIDAENNSVNFYMLDIDTLENVEQGSFTFGDQQVDLQEKLVLLTEQLKQTAGDAVITLQ